MEYIYAVMLLNKAGKEVNESAVSKVLKAADVEVDSAKVKSLIAALDGVDIEKVISESSSVAVASPASTSSTQSDDNSSKEEDKKEDKKEDSEPAADAAAGLGSLF